MTFLQLFILLIIALGSFKKFQLRGAYLEPADLNLITEGMDITTIINQYFTLKSILILILMTTIIIFIIIFLIRKSASIHIKYRLGVTLLSIIGVVLFIFYPSIYSLKATTEGNVDSYSKLGLIGGFFTLQERGKLVHPTEYSKNNIKKITKSPSDSTDAISNFKPNIIVVLAEAFWDPLLLENLTFKEDPIPYYRSLTKTGTTGKLLTHFYGGGTFNTELDILTGLSSTLLPDGSDTYFQYIDHPVDSLAHNLKNQGYHTTAIHTFRNWFYDRNITYRWLGFEKFVSMEFFENPDHIGLFIDDRELMRQTLKEIEKTDGPDFINTVTVSSHGPYNDIRYVDPLNHCTTTQQLNQDSQYILDLYCQLLSETDAAIKILIEGIKQIEEPTMVVIYGDHLPMLGEEYAVYREANYFENTNTDYQNYLKMYSTPLLIWDNFSAQADEAEELRMTPNFLGAYILSLAKKAKSPIFQLADEIYNHETVVIPKKTYDEDAGVNRTKLKNYELLQYDVLFGERFSYEDIKVVPEQNYFLGSNKMHIKSVTIKEEENEEIKIEVKGEHFISNAKIYINGVEQDSTFKNNSLIFASIGKSEKELKIILKLKDDKNSVIAKSNEYKIKVEN
ncbi:LTA synthase family protein [Bacillaceae bacterium CLA-AA-H227]|uniref:LTA synthase family protein n=1 Tax=Robertmurraya yapensis (ex Hitch et al 2024) TaxID=3133160 RepID=A0ACC6SEU8_9BACI